MNGMQGLERVLETKERIIECNGEITEENENERERNFGKCIREYAN